jgi:hypothetical protein
MEVKEENRWRGVVLIALSIFSDECLSLDCEMEKKNRRLVVGSTALVQGWPSGETTSA